MGNCYWLHDRWTNLPCHVQLHFYFKGLAYSWAFGSNFFVAFFQHAIQWTCIYLREKVERVYHCSPNEQDAICFYVLKCLLIFPAFHSCAEILQFHADLSNLNLWNGTSAKGGQVFSLEWSIWGVNTVTWEDNHSWVKIQRNPEIEKKS